MARLAKKSLEFVEYGILEQKILAHTIFQRY